MRGGEQPSCRRSAAEQVFQTPYRARKYRYYGVWISELGDGCVTARNCQDWLAGREDRVSRPGDCPVRTCVGPHDGLAELQTRLQSGGFGLADSSLENCPPAANVLHFRIPGYWSLSRKNLGPPLASDTPRLALLDRIPNAATHSTCGRYGRVWILADGCRSTFRSAAWSRSDTTEFGSTGPVERLREGLAALRTPFVSMAEGFNSAGVSRVVSGLV